MDVELNGKEAMICYLCNSKITKSNKSEEHVFLNSLGGKLKLRGAVCSDCNSKHGTGIDATLSRQLLPIASMLNIKRERGVARSIEAKDENGNPMILKPGMIPVKKTQVTKKRIDNDFEYVINAPDAKKAREIVEGIIKKYPGANIDADEVLAGAKLRKDSVGRGKVSVGIGGPDSFRSIAKSVANFYLLRGGKSGALTSLVPYITSEKGEQPVYHYHPPKDVVTEKTEILHSVIIKGDCCQRCLVGYIELFSTYSFYVLISENYEGDDYEEAYFFDVVDQKEVKRSYNLISTAKEIQAVKSNAYRNMHRLGSKAQQLSRAIHAKHYSAYLDPKIKNAIDKTLGAHPEGVPITPKMMKELREEIRKEFQAFCDKIQENRKPESDLA